MKQPLKNSGLSLLQKQEAQKVLVAKMRTRLAGGSEFDVKILENKNKRIHKSRFRLVVKIGMAAIIILGNLAYLGFKSETINRVQVKHAPGLPLPNTNLTLDDQALYWTYALYDYNLLKSRFGIHQEVVINGVLATEKIRTLMPKIDAKTRFIINQYLPQTKNNS